MSNAPAFNGIIANALYKAWGDSAPNLFVIFYDADDMGQENYSYVSPAKPEKSNQVESYYQCFNPHQKKRVLGFGHSEYSIISANGLVVSPEYLDSSKKTTAYRTEFLKSIGLSPNIPTILIMFGGNGSNKISGILKKRQEALAPFHKILIQVFKIMIR